MTDPRLPAPRAERAEPRPERGLSSAGGLRVLAVAAADRPAVPAPGDLEQGLRLLGLVGILDPPRRAAAGTIAACQAAGITPVLITGDHPATARAIAVALGTTQLAVALGSRARPGSLANPMLPAAVGGALALQFAALYLPLLQELLHTQPLTGLDLLVVFVLSTLGYTAIRVDRVLFRRKRPPAAAGAASGGAQDSHS